MASQAQNWTGNVNFFLGGKVLDEDDWAPLDEQPEFGILIDFKQHHWPVSIAIDLLHSRDDHGQFVGNNFLNVEGNTTELNLGVRKIWDHFPRVRPYIGGGLAIINAEVEASVSGAKVSVDDTGAGFWINGGVYWTLGKSFNIGIDLRYSKAEVTFFNVDIEAGGVHTGLLLGIHW
jgi:opacity protein-like surface antigen